MNNNLRRAPTRLPAPSASQSSLLRTYISVFSSFIGAAILGIISYSNGSNNDGAQFLLAVSVFLFFIILMNSISTRSGLAMTLFGLYFIFFLAFPGMLHASQNRFPFYSMSYNSNDVFDAAVVVLVFAIGSLVGYILAMRHWREPVIAPPRPPAFGEDRTQTVATTSALGIACIIAAAVLLIMAVGPGLFLARRADLGEFDMIRNELTTTLVATARTLAIIALVASWHRMKLGGKRSVVLPLFLASIALNVIANFPLAIPRFTLFGSLLILLHLVFDVTQPRFKALLSISMVVLMGTVLPFISFLQKNTQDVVFDFDFVGYFMDANDLDGFQSIVNVVMLSDGTGYRYGWQLLSALMAFIPRSVWPDKGIPTGSEAANYAGYQMVNISSPLPSELLVDFGLIGTAIGAIIFTYFVTKIDQLYVSGGKVQTLRRVLLFGGVAGYIIIVLRGALLGIIAPISLYFLLTLLLTAPPFKRDQRIRG